MKEKKMKVLTKSIEGIYWMAMFFVRWKVMLPIIGSLSILKIVGAVEMTWTALLLPVVATNNTGPSGSVPNLYS